MTDTDPTRTGTHGEDATAPSSGRGGRLPAMAGAALLAGVLAGAATGLAGLAAWHLSGDGAQERSARMALVELAEASGRLATTVALFARSDRPEREAASLRLDLDTARLSDLLSRLPGNGDGDDSGAAAAMRRLLARMDTELADLRRTVERRDEEERGLEAMVAEVRDRHAAFRRSLDPAAGMAATRLRLDDLAGGLAAHLFTALATSGTAGIDERRSAVTQLADHLHRSLDALPVGSSAVRLTDAARRLTSLGVDAGNVFERRLAIAELDAAAVTAARNARDRAEAMGALAHAGHDGSGPDGAAIAPPLLAAAVASGLAAALGVAATLRPTTSGTPPPSPPGPATAQRGDTEAAGLPPLTIVVAEDERLNQMVAAALLRRNGHTVITVDDGLGAVEAVEREAVDLVLMDLRMPKLDGIGALRRIRGLSDPVRARTRIVVLTASAIPDDAEAARDAGADAVLTKPLRWDRLEPLLRHLFAGAAPPRPEEAANPPDAGPPDAGSAATGSAAPPEFDDGAVRQMREMLPAARVAALIETTHAALTEHHRALMAAWAAGKHEEVSALAHRIAGVSGVYGCTGLRAAAQALELAIDRGDADIGPLVRRVDAAAGPALAYLRSLLAEEEQRG